MIVMVVVVIFVPLTVNVSRLYSNLRHVLVWAVAVVVRQSETQAPAFRERKAAEVAVPDEVYLCCFASKMK